MQVINYKNVRIPWTLPPYPGYHKGPNLEEYFFEYYMKNRVAFDATGYTLIPIWWTSAYLNHVNVQPYIDHLPKNNKYFCVCQHDDAVKEVLPPGTKVFAAGGNGGGIPIPLISSPIPKEYLTPNYRELKLATFVGAITHPVRQRMYDALEGDIAIDFTITDWNFNIPKDNMLNFFETTKTSMFTLCPRGYGAQSFRTYEAIQLGSVPVYIHDDNLWLPFKDRIPWDDFCVIIHIDEIDMLPNILRKITNKEYTEMRRVGDLYYKNYFTLEAMSLTILEELQDENN